MAEKAEKMQSEAVNHEVNNAVLAIVHDRDRVLEENKRLQGQLALAHKRIYDLETGRDD